MTIPKPLKAVYPDGGLDASHMHECRGCDHITAHEDGTLRVWRGFPTIRGTGPPNELPYYPIEVIGMTDDEINRAVSVAMQMLAMTPVNRKQRRAMN